MPDEKQKNGQNQDQNPENTSNPSQQDEQQQLGSTISANSIQDKFAALVNRINTAVEQHEPQGIRALSIYVGNYTVFKGEIGRQPQVNSIDSQQIELIEKAITDPSGVKGSVRMSVNGQPVLNVKNGKVKLDILGLTNQQTVQQSPAQNPSFQVAAPQAAPSAKPTKTSSKESSTTTLKAQMSALEAKVNSLEAAFQNLQQGTQQSFETVNQRLGALEAQVSAHQANDDRAAQQIAGLEHLSQENRKLIQQQQQLIAHLEQRLEALAQSTPAPTNTVAGHWLTTVQSRIATAGVSLKHQVEAWGQGLQQRVSHLQNTVDAQKMSLTERINSAALGAMKSATVKVAELVGEKRPDGSVVVNSHAKQEQMVVQGDKISIQPTPPLNREAIWKHYSALVSGRVPADITKGVAQQALRDNRTHSEVMDILKADPEFKRLAQLKGQGKAEAYSRLAIAAAERSQRSTGPGPQAQRQQTAQRQQYER